MIWRIDANRAVGRKANQPRAVIELSADELYELLDATVHGVDPDRFSLEVDLRAAQAAIIAAGRRR